MEKEALTNFIPISRKLFEHQLWCEEREFSRFEAWIYLLKEARFEDTKLYDGNKIVEVKRGQIYASIRFLAEAWKWSRKKVCGFLEMLVSDEMIIKETAKETGQTVLTICNYDRYNADKKIRGQLRRQQGDSKGTKYNKDNTDNNNIPPNSPPEVEVEKSWRDDFNIYLTELTKSYNDLILDKVFIQEREKYHPNIDILLTLEKAYKDYWSTEVAWKKRKRSKTEKLDWKATFRNSLDQRFNHVYKQKNTQPEKPSVYVIPD